MEIITRCPVCNKEEFNLFLNCLDFTVSRETFSIVQCTSCNFKFTNPRPESDSIGNYYQSDDYISHSNTSKGFINFTYKIIRKYTLLKKLQLISKFYKTGSILDIGCGTGEFLNTCKDAQWKTVGIEPDDKTRKTASDRYALNIYSEDYLHELQDESFEIITMWHVLEHVPFLNERIKDLKRLVKPNGIIIIAVPNCDSLDAKIYKENWAAYDVPRHLYHFTPQTLEHVFKNHELKLFNILPMIFDSFYVSMLSEKIKRGKPNLLCSMWNGFRSNLNGIKTGKTYSSQIYLIRK
jgi:2-polyprenyl-3-methyl-5-hydroxy-6-metoxy-1,4-benzoquinol methylase